MSFHGLQYLSMSCLPTSHFINMEEGEVKVLTQGCTNIFIMVMEKFRIFVWEKVVNMSQNGCSIVLY